MYSDRGAIPCRSVTIKDQNCPAVTDQPEGLSICTQACRRRGVKELDCTKLEVGAAPRKSPSTYPVSLVLPALASTSNDNRESREEPRNSLNFEFDVPFSGMPV